MKSMQKSSNFIVCGLCYCLAGIMLASCTSSNKEQPIKEVIDNALDLAAKQSLRMAAKYETQEGILPRSFEHGEMTTSDSKWWTSGFFPGTLWYLYENSNNEELLKYARLYTARIEKEQYTTSNHDVGFMLYCSYGNGLRITGDSTYKAVLLQGAKSLSTRFSPKIGLIRSWDWTIPEVVWQYPVIIDNMMNLELLLWASKNTPDTTFRHIVVSHADKTMEHHFRDNMSCYHVVSYDTISGLPHIKQTHQGCADESAWARGQAWGLYGYSFMYRETKEVRYLEQAKKIASFLIHHPNMPADMIPYWDFNAPNIPNEPRDASAAALIASALIEMSGFVNEELSKHYLSIAEKQIRTLASPQYTAALGDNGDFILKHAVGNMPKQSEVDAPLTYADYYYVEALLRYKKLIGD